MNELLELAESILKCYAILTLTRYHQGKLVRIHIVEHVGVKYAKSPPGVPKKEVR